MSCWRPWKVLKQELGLVIERHKAFLTSRRRLKRLNETAAEQIPGCPFYAYFVRLGIPNTADDVRVDAINRNADGRTIESQNLSKSAQSEKRKSLFGWPL